MSDPKILTFDIETSPMEVYTFGVRDQFIGNEQVKEDWFVLSWAAKWVGSEEVIHRDQRGSKVLSNDKAILKDLWNLLDRADIVIGQNVIEFDCKRVNSRFLYHGFKPPSPYQVIDTLQMARKRFGFSSNKLEWLTEKINKKYKKYKTRRFQGMELWKACLNRNAKAFAEMKKYNILDVLSTEELYTRLAPWGTSVNPFTSGKACSCGSTKIQKQGLRTTTVGHFQRYQCQSCGRWYRDGKNLLTGTPKLLRGI